MATTLWTIFFALGAFGFFFGAMMLGTWFGRRRQRRCACAESRAVMQQVADREKAARDAARYTPESVDPSVLPILPSSLLDESRRTE